MRRSFGFLAFAVVALLVGCGGGNSSSGPGSIPGPRPTPTPGPGPASQTQTILLGPSVTAATFAAISTGAAGTVTFPATASGTAQGTLTLRSSLPSGIPIPQSKDLHGLVRGQNIGSTVGSIAYLTLAVSSNVTLGASPAVAMTFPETTLAGISGGYAYLVFYNPAEPNAGWNILGSSVAAAGTSLTFPTTTVTATSLTPGTTYVYAIVTSLLSLTSAAPSSAPSSGPTSTPGAGGGVPLNGPTAGPNNGWAPTALANALQFPVQSGYNGANQTIAIVMDAYPETGDLASYASYFGIPSTTRSITTENVDGGAPTGTGTTDFGEVTLDTETIAGLAPGANIIVYGIPQLTSQAITDAFSQIESDGTAKVVNFSAGGCEYSGITSDSVLQQGAASGIAFVAASGDEGNVCATPSTVGVDYPASDPNVTGVGGSETDNQAGHSLLSTYVWNDTTCVTGQCAGGGGVSAFFSLPSYQSNLAGTSSTTFRNVPDVSMPAVDDSIFSAGSWSLVNGTSWASPQYAALVAELYEYCKATVPNPVTIPYSIRAISSSALLDIVHGDDQFGTATPFYTAGPGYDNASGLGVPLGITYANTLCPNRTLTARARRPSAMAYAQHRPSEALRLDVTPRFAELSDRGRRDANAPTRIQIVLLPSSTVAADERAVIAALRDGGFTIAQTFRNHLVVDALAPSGTVERFFSTEMHDATQGKYGTRYLPTMPAVVPASLAPYVSAVNLDDVVTMHVPR